MIQSNTKTEKYMKQFLIIGSISGMLAVALGAFGAHALKEIINADMLTVYKTASQYHYYHTFAILVVAILLNFKESKVLNWSGYLFVAGTLLFSGSLYILAITGISKLGIITPFGGVILIAAWVCLLLHALKLKR